MPKKKTTVVTLHAKGRRAWSPRRAFLLGVLTGSRSMTPAAVLAAHHDSPALRGDWRDWPVFGSPVGRGLVVVAALGELLGDKSPKAPPRTTPMALAGRAAFGAVVGAALGTTARGGAHRLQGALLGATGAVVGSVLGLRARALVGEVTGLPDPVVALAEDALAVGGSLALVRGA